MGPTPLRMTASAGAGRSLASASITITVLPASSGTMPMKLAQIASALGARLENGSPDTEITGVAGIEEAGPGQLTFVANPKYAAAARTTKASAVIVAEDFPAFATAMLRSKNPYLAFARAIALFHPPPQYAPGIHPTAVVHPSARIGEGAHIGPYVVVGEGRRDREERRAAGACGHLSRRENRRQLLRPRSCRGARALPPGKQRAAAERRGHRRRRLRLREG